MHRSDENERAFQQTIERYAREASEAYRNASERLDAARAGRAAEEAAHEATRAELSRADRSRAAAEGAAAEGARALAAAVARRRRLERELDAAEEEFERRDAERAACDGRQRDLRECRAAAAAAATGTGDGAAAELARAREEVETLRRRVRSLREGEAAREAAIVEGRARSQEWEGKARSVMEKIASRHRKEVLDR